MIRGRCTEIIKFEKFQAEPPFPGQGAENLLPVAAHWAWG